MMRKIYRVISAGCHSSPSLPELTKENNDIFVRFNIAKYVFAVDVFSFCGCMTRAIDVERKVDSLLCSGNFKKSKADAKQQKVFS